MNIKILIIGIVLFLSLFSCSVSGMDAYNYGIYSYSEANLYWKNATYDAKCDGFTSMDFTSVAPYGGIDDCRRSMSIISSIYMYSSKYWWEYVGNTGRRSVYYSNISFTYNNLIQSTTTGCGGSGGIEVALGPHIAYFYPLNTNTFNISGNTCGIDNVTLQIYDGAYYNINYTNTSDENTYSFSIIDNVQYKLNFSDGHEYEFTVDGTDISYDYSLCQYITLNFKEDCGNLIRKTAGTYYNSDDPYALNFYTSTGTYNILFEDQNYLEIWADSAAGTLYYNISNPQNNTIITYTILNPTIAWNNNIYVIDGNTSFPIEGALVMFSQDCIIMPTLYPSRNKFINTSGLVFFRQCELDSFSLGVSATNYKAFSDNNISSNNLSAFLLEQTIIVKLYSSTDENESEYDYTDYGTGINFKDVNGNYTTSILDTDNYVDLHYFNNNTEDVSMTLKFQKYNISTGFTTLLSWNIPKEMNGYKRILKSNYTDTTSSYRGYLYNYTIDGWDKTKYLAVRNETDEIVLNYENLSTNLWFRYKNIEGNIDYREDINIYAYANTSYVGLFDISLELYDNAVYVEHINLTWADFVNADFFFYEWDPDYSYINGHNYTVRMHGYDYYLLDLDYINASDYRKNKLTILVKNQYGTDLTNCFIYLEDYGSLSTNTNNYNSYENLDNGYYRYRATKPNYVATGWSDITLSDSDEIVTYVLTWSGSEEGSATQQQKISDGDLSNIYLILMAIILIFIILGGFIYATK